ncbi:medium-chain acyl-CoA ligase ACSF2, mitochondrial [Hylaeus anthracinus]|uniref:medium-chain acyl-CoA ligase ACSF2, mitochondrial n=1 Tax=Hylaeus anthracinus TaxID=313031 RepID=UPI0023BA3979|nr:medium-chain acyl-CoA ligase ACSF2, mitochondrial [Hylaeus anthracinus]
MHLSWISRSSVLLSATSSHVQCKHASARRNLILVCTRALESHSAWTQQKRFRHDSKTKLAHMSLSGDIPLLDTTVGVVLGEAAKRWPDHECIVSVHQNVRLTLANVVRRADCLAAGLKKLGLKQGDRLGIWAPNDIEWYISFMASARAGLITVAINPSYQMSEIVYCLNKVGTKVVIAPDSFKTQNYPNMLLECRRVCPSLEHIIIYSKDHVTGTRRFADVEQLASKKEVEAIAEEQGAISCFDGCNIQFTSGTTGKPKATMLSHRSLANNSRQVSARTYDPPGTKACMNVPFFHAFGMTNCMALLHKNTTLVLESRSFNPVTSVETMLRENCEVAYGTPTMWITLLDVYQKLQLPPIKLVAGYIGGAPASPHLFKRIREAFHFERMKTIYGQTEATGVVFQSLLEEDTELTDTTVGHMQNHLEVKVVDENGAIVPFGTRGELYIRGYSTMVKYWNDEENTKKTLTEDGWLKSGDQFILREDGYGVIVGRIKDMVIRGGENIFPKEIEDFLMTHPSVSEAHVIGAYDEVYGEELCACVRLNDGSRLTKEELRDYCKGKIAHFKIPRYVVFVQEYPKTSSGKVQKFLLKKEMERKGEIPSAPNDSITSAATGNVSSK